MATAEVGIIVPDCHVPYQDKRCLNLVRKVIKGVNPKHLVILGDFGDFYSISSHDKDPQRVRDLEYEVGLCNEELDKFEALKVPNVVFCEGNHENRLSRYLMKKAPELFGFFSTDQLFQLKRRKWKFVPYRQHCRVGKLHFTHEYGRHGKYAAQQTLDAFQHNIVFGHSHRAQLVYGGNLVGETHVSLTCGTLMDFKQVDYMHQGQLKDWQHGFGLFYKLPNNICQVHFVPIVHHTCVVERKVYTA